MGEKRQRLRSVRFTTRWLENVKPPAKGQVDYYDSSPGSPAGFGVRVSQGGTRSFFVLYRRERIRKRWTIGRFPALSLKEARRRAGKVQHSKRDDPLQAKKDLQELGTFDNLAAEYIAEADLADSTRREFRRIIKRDLIPEFGPMHAGSITRKDVKAFLKKKKKTPYMANRILAVMRLVFAWAVADDDRPIFDSPCDGITRKELGTKKEKARQRVLTPDEIRAIWTALDQERPLIASIFKLLLLTGVRSDEAKRARWDELSIEERLWRISTTKNDEPHEVPLTEAAVAVLESMRPLSGHSDYVFLGPTGKHVANLQKAKERLQNRVQFAKDWRIHDLRRTVATNLAELGVPRDTVSAVLGHALGGNPTTAIYERYARLPEKRAALEKWARRLEHIVTGEKGTVVAFGS